MLSKAYGMAQPTSLDSFLSLNTKIDLALLIKNGRAVTIDQFLKAKEEFNFDKALQKQLVRDRSTYIVYKDQIAEEEEGVQSDIEFAESVSCNVRKTFKEDQQKKGKKANKAAKIKSTPQQPDKKPPLSSFFN